jgi:alkylation response protein AidB-like acyl-CoA dehydrogenase
MDLRYSDEDELFREEVRVWLARAVPTYGKPPPAGDWEARRAYDTGWQRTLHDAGYAGLAWPSDYGGRGLPVTQQLVFLEEYAAADAPYTGVNFVGNMHAGPTLIAEGTDEQRRFHLPRILRGESVWCQGFSEPEAGSDLASLRTRAVRDGDDYVVTGQKIWSTRAHVADYCELLVRTDPEALGATDAAPDASPGTTGRDLQRKHRGITWLILDMHQPGVEVRPLRTIDGESHFCEVFLDEARVPVANRVGDEDDGWRVTNVTLRFERGTAFAQHVVNLRSQLGRLVDRTIASGSGAWDDAGLRRQVGRIDAGIDALWRLTQMCITEADRSGVPSPLGSAVKLRYSELGQELSELAVRLSGRRMLGVGTGSGSCADDDLAEVIREYLWSFQLTIAAGTSQIQRNLVAERILGMPKGR